jgi:hypothetical protein
LPLSRKDIRTPSRVFGHVPFLRPTYRSGADAEAPPGLDRPSPAWLVLLDEGRVIRATGFDLGQLKESLKDKSLDRLPSR